MNIGDQTISPTNLRDIETFEDRFELERMLPAQTIYGVFQASAARYGERSALSLVLTGDADETARRVSYRDLLEGITRSANLFAVLAGPEAGVAYLLPSLIETYFVLWGAETSGYAVPVNPLLTAEHILELVQSSGAKILVTVGPGINAQIWEKSVHVKQSLPDVVLVCISAPANPEVECISFEAGLARHRGDALAFERRNLPDSIVAYFHTGGTTGLPKLVAHTNRNQICAAFGFVALMGLRETDRVGNGLPLFHVAGTISCSLAFFMCGAEVIILSPLGLRNPAMVQRFWHIVERYGVTVIGGVPTSLAAILAVPVTGSLATVRFGLTGAAALPLSVSERFAAVTGKQLHEILGMTESGGVTAVDPAGCRPTPGSVGYRVPYTQLRVRHRDETGQLGDDCAPGEIGVLFVAGPTVSPGYRDPLQNAGVFTDGGLNTGDLAYFGADGKLFIAGRAKDVIIRSGHNIDPAMVEAAFERCPSVAMAAVVAQPDPYAGELPVAYVTLAPGSVAAEEDLMAFAREHIAERPAWPKHVYIVDALPLTAVGKLYKPALRCDATVRLLKAILSDIAPAASAAVEVHDGGKRGLEVAVTLTGADDAIVDQIDAELRKFVFRHTVRHAGANV